eukprot:3889499-Rhodomonas_salina.1
MLAPPFISVSNAASFLDSAAANKAVLPPPFACTSLLQSVHVSAVFSSRAFAWQRAGGRAGGRAGAREEREESIRTKQMFTSAPPSMSACTAPAWPFSAARKSAVLPSCSRAHPTLAPASGRCTKR